MGIKSTLLMSAMLLSVYINAQSPNHQVVDRLNMVNVWDEHAFSELSESDRMNKVAYTDSGVVGSYSMDLVGYLLCVFNFENAARAADHVYGNAKIILVDVVLPPEAGQALDAIYMDKAYREGLAKMHIIREYRMNATEKVQLSFICNDRERYFEASTKRMQ